MKLWPKAKYYAVYAYVPETMGGAAAGGEQFNRRVGAWMRAVADHLHETGVDPRRFLILLVDELGGGKADEQQLHWSRAVKAAVPEFVIFCDPSNAAPHTTGLRAMDEVADIAVASPTRRSTSRCAA